MMFSVDVEDWFCSPTLSLSEWNGFQSRIEQPLYEILELLGERSALGTFFVLGWIAEKRPDLIAEIHRRGHEIASHGYSHRLIYNQSVQEFRDDVRKSKDILEHIIGSKVRGYRAPCFSMTRWGLEILIEEGFSYDSSIMPNTPNTIYSKFNLAPSVSQPFIIKSGLWEIPMPVYRLGNINIPWGGGGYFRIYPYSFYNLGVKKILKNQGSFIFYIHPYDLDEQQPQIFNSSWSNNFRRYYGLKNTSYKLKNLLSEFACTSISHYYPHVSNL